MSAPATLCELHVRLADRYAGFDSDKPELQALEQEIAQSLERLCQQLQLPYTAYEVIVESLTDPDATKSMRLTVNGMDCRLPVVEPAHDTLLSITPARAVLNAVHAERHLLLRPELSSRLHARLEKTGIAARKDFTDLVYHRLLCMLLRRGFHIGRANRLNEQAHEGTLEPETLYDLAVDWLDTQLQILVPDRPVPVEDETVAGGSTPRELGSLLELMHDGLFFELGLVLPTVTIEVGPGLADHEFQIRLNDVDLPIVRGIEPNEILVNDTVGALSLLHLEAREGINSATGARTAITSADARQRCIDAGYTTWNQLEYIILQTSAVIRAHASTFVTDELVQRQLDVLSMTFPDPVRAARERFSVLTITHVLRQLLDEELSVRDLRGVLETMLTVNALSDANMAENIVFASAATRIPFASRAQQLDQIVAADYAAVVRAAFRRAISHKYTRGRSTLTVYLLQQELEARLSRADLEPLDPDEHRRVVEAVSREVLHNTDVVLPVILTGVEARAQTRAAIEREFPTLAVLSYNDLSPEMNIQPISRIEWSDL